LILIDYFFENLPLPVAVRQWKKWPGRKSLPPNAEIDASRGKIFRATLAVHGCSGFALKIGIR
jgi:hypothetical protein